MSVKGKAFSEEHRRRISEGQRRSWASGSRLPVTVSWWRHGTLYGYVEKLCRCDLCRAANTAHVRERRARRRARTEERTDAGDATA